MTAILLSSIVALLTELSKKLNITDPRIVAAVFSLVVGGVYTFLVNDGILTQKTLETLGLCYAGAVALFDTLKPFFEKKE